MGRLVVIATPPWGQEYRVNEDMTIGVGAINVPVITHGPDQCEGENCCFHNPSDHPLKDADMVLRLDKYALIERLCPHGIGHDDPDSVVWLHSRGQTWAGVHGCDGCCGKGC